MFTPDVTAGARRLHSPCGAMPAAGRAAGAASYPDGGCCRRAATGKLNWSFRGSRSVSPAAGRSSLAADGGLVMTGSAVGGIPGPAKQRGYGLTAGVLLVMMLGGTLPVPLYVLYEKQMGFGPLGVTVVFAAYVAGTLFALVVLGDLSDHIGRKKVLAIAVACAAVSTALFLAASGLAASGIGVLIAARVVSGMAAGLAPGTATAALTELQPRG